MVGGGFWGQPPTATAAEEGGQDKEVARWGGGGVGDCNWCMSQTLRSEVEHRVWLKGKVHHVRDFFKSLRWSK